MKTVQQYICEVCGTQYADKEQAEKCESNHKKDLKIANARYLPITSDASGLPTTITIEYKEGKYTRTATYKH